jgi:hypothetical protein
MRRLVLWVLAGVFCLALLSIPAEASLYDPRTPPPTPSVTIGGDLNAGEASWGDPTHARKPIQPGNNEEQRDQRSIGNATSRDLERPLGFWWTIINHLKVFMFPTNHNSGVAKP